MLHLIINYCPQIKYQFMIFLGADYGAGKRANTFSSFMCALRDGNSPDDNPRYLTLRIQGCIYFVERIICMHLSEIF